MQWEVHILCLSVCFSIVSGVPFNKTVYLSGSLGVNDSDRTPSSPEITSSHLDVKEYSYSDIFRTLPPTNSSEEMKKKKKKHRKKHMRKKNASGFWTKAGTAVASLVNGYNAIRRNFGNGNRRSDYDYNSDDYSEGSESKPKKQLRPLEATTMSNVEQAYWRSMTFTPRYRGDDHTTKPTKPKLKKTKLDSKSTEETDKLDRRKDKSIAEPKRKKTAFKNNRKKSKIGKSKMKLESGVSKIKGEIKDLIGRRSAHRQLAGPGRHWPSTSYIKPILSTTGKVIRGLDTLAYYGSYFSYTLLPMSIAAVQTVKNMLPAPETVAKLERAAPLAVL